MLADALAQASTAEAPMGAAQLKLGAHDGIPQQSLQQCTLPRPLSTNVTSFTAARPSYPPKKRLHAVPASRWIRRVLIHFCTYNSCFEMRYCPDSSPGSNTKSSMNVPSFFPWPRGPPPELPSKGVSAAAQHGSNTRREVQSATSEGATVTPVTLTSEVYTCTCTSSIVQPTSFTQGTA